MYHKHDGAEAVVGLFKFTVASKMHIINKIASTVFSICYNKYLKSFCTSVL